MNTNDPGREPGPTDAAVLMELARQYDENIAPNWPNRIWDRVEIAADRGREYLSGARPMPDTPAPDEVAQLRAEVAELKNFIECAGTITMASRNNSVRDHVNHARTVEARIADLEAEVARLVAERGRYITLYHDLLMSVGYTHPSETRHETAKRYILSAENQNSSPCAAMSRKAASDA